MPRIPAFVYTAAEETGTPTETAEQIYLAYLERSQPLTVDELEPAA